MLQGKFQSCERIFFSSLMLRHFYRIRYSYACFFALVGLNVPAPVALFSAKKGGCHMKSIQSVTVTCTKTTGPEPVKDGCRTGFQVFYDEMYMVSLDPSGVVWCPAYADHPDLRSLPKTAFAHIHASKKSKLHTYDEVIAIRFRGYTLSAEPHRWGRCGILRFQVFLVFQHRWICPRGHSWRNPCRGSPRWVQRGETQRWQENAADFEILRCLGYDHKLTSPQLRRASYHHIRPWFRKKKTRAEFGDSPVSKCCVFPTLQPFVFPKKRVAINRLPFFHGVSEPQLGSGRQSHQHLGCRVSSRFAGGIC